MFLTRGDSLAGRAGKHATLTRRATCARVHGGGTHPKYRRSHIQGARRGHPSALRLRSDPGAARTAPFLARSSQHYLDVASVFFEVQLARTRSQSRGRAHGRARSQPMRAPTAARNAKKPRRQSSPVQPLLRLSYCHTRGELEPFLYIYISIYYYAYSYFDVILARRLGVAVQGRVELS